MRQKGTVVMLVSIIILLIAVALISSFAFNRVSIQVRELSEATIVYEGDEMEAFARAIDTSIEQAVAQGVQEYYRNHENEIWGEYDSSSVPSDDAVAGEIKGYASPHVNNFLTAFAKEAESRKFSLGHGSGIEELKMQPKSLSEPGTMLVSLPQVSMSKTLEEFATASYDRKFTPGTSIKTTLPDMLKFIREKLVGSNNVLNPETVKAIGYPGTEINTNMDKLAYPKRGNKGYEEKKTRDMRAYIDQDSTCTAGSGEPSSRACFKTGQTSTRGALEYCSIDESKVTYRCGGCPYLEPFYPDPSDEEVYVRSHGGMSYGSASAKIQEYVWERILANEYSLDEQTPTFTVAFDGKNFEDPEKFDSIENSISIESRVTGSCQEPKVIGLCNGVQEGFCKGDPPKPRYKCYQKKSVVCDYNYFTKSEVSVRVQEDGFTYGVRDTKKGKDVADTFKLVFRTIAGNGKNVLG
jgi:hypothetical protein